mmetsp:Transcript_43035/g.82104  ORF Transcript_43035/g.82104 Transcript_43035/m.82104 type:complete len:435 (+) Transcript_43035:1718-3022(+)
MNLEQRFSGAPWLLCVCRRRIVFLSIRFISLLSLGATVMHLTTRVYMERLSSTCVPIMNMDTYTAIRTHDDHLMEAHLYKSRRECGQMLFHDHPTLPMRYLNESEKYANDILTTYGSGYIDFSWPDMKSVDYGFTTFPHKHCEYGQRTTGQRIVLSTMITAEGKRHILLPQFIAHYEQLGVSKENMLFTIHVPPECNLPIVKSLIEQLHGNGIYYDTFVGQWTSEALMFHQAHKLKACTASSDWIIVADSDEFHEYPAPVPLFFQRLDRGNYNVVNGMFLDRVSLSGQLKPLTNIPVHRQFPLGCRLHKVFNLGTPKKVMAFKGYLRINRGHHRLALCWFWARRQLLHVSPWDQCPPYPEPPTVKVYEKRLNVHHFKWIEDQIESSKRKMHAYNGSKVALNYMAVLKHIHLHAGVCTTCASCFRAPSLHVKHFP